MNELTFTDVERLEVLERKVADLQMICALTFHFLADDNTALKKDFIERLQDTAELLEADFDLPDGADGACREVAGQLARYL